MLLAQHPQYAGRSSLATLKFRHEYNAANKVDGKRKMQPTPRKVPPTVKKPPATMEGPIDSDSGTTHTGYRKTAPSTSKARPKPRCERSALQHSMPARSASEGRKEGRREGREEGQEEGIDGLISRARAGRTKAWRVVTADTGAIHAFRFHLVDETSAISYDTVQKRRTLRPLNARTAQ